MNKSVSAVALLLVTAVFMGGYSEQARSEASSVKKEITSDDVQHEFKNLNDRYSYAYGADLAEKFKTEGVELNVDMMAEAMRDVFGDGDRKMSTGEIAATIDIYMKIHEKKKEAERAAAGKENKKKSEAFMAENAGKDGMVVTESGLQYRVISEGDGGYSPTEDDVVTVHYRGTFIDGTEFDSTYSRNQPYSVKVSKLIEGWGEALQLMSEGAKWELYVPAELAYGEEGSGEYIGPNTALVFEVELLDIEEGQESQKDS
ncbi:FKBP-type peptidyl-prolyl cis-trans isomerase FkpA/FKBP-type peptidyl-prolyl cis-trans isomerase FklB [Marinobacter daqiaonensis]|uniref:Peptidyl-prolyl cis-trans isomerase n=1 Tax=Marinobacter daqiaonensis TaxID=650891 RepID=A0A1I6GZF4_9GAMM|nr:FKBP-type peptidyl-prolyl cis-trans isomerase [Marinobacter daqiaonensis]SFR47487.1 FKBP-type peptidyl-prolyl cis-trans isomerase FkpA/FKBP-type peptidyl-prolyl cis-trans isomerase FklB [Marinobacter daqiaonensis]